MLPSETNPITPIHPEQDSEDAVVKTQYPVARIQNKATFILPPDSEQSTDTNAEQLTEFSRSLENQIQTQLKEDRGHPSSEVIPGQLGLNDDHSSVTTPDLITDLARINAESSDVREIEIIISETEKLQSSNEKLIQQLFDLQDKVVP